MPSFHNYYYRSKYLLVFVVTFDLCFSFPLFALLNLNSVLKYDSALCSQKTTFESWPLESSAFHDRFPY